MGKIVNTAIGVPTGEKKFVPDSTGAGEPAGPTGQELADNAGAVADADRAANVAGLAAVGKREDATVNRRRA